MDMLARHTLGSSHITGLGYVLYQWICIMKKTDMILSLVKLEWLVKLPLFIVMTSGMMMLQ
eukprot:10416103-Ditylum_brightwellii.AAC.1